MKTQKQYIRAARQDDRYMPNTQRQGWGQVTGQKTKVTLTEVNGVRTIKRESI